MKQEIRISWILSKHDMTTTSLLFLAQAGVYNGAVHLEELNILLKRRYGSLTFPLPSPPSWWAAAGVCGILFLHLPWRAAAPSTGRSGHGASGLSGCGRRRSTMSPCAGRSPAFEEADLKKLQGRHGSPSTSSYSSSGWLSSHLCKYVWM